MAKSKVFPPFDRVRRDNDSGGYKQSLTHGKHKIDFCFQAETKEELERLLPTAAKFWRGRNRWFKEFRDYAATELLDELNGCLDDGEDEPIQLTAVQLRKLLPAPFLVSFYLDEDEEDEQVMFQMSGGEDEKTLQENCIEVTGNLSDGITEGTIESLM